MVFKSQRRECFCAYCKNQRKVYRSKHLSVLAVTGFIGLSLIFSALIWSTVDPRSLIILTVFLLIGELFYQLRWRQSMICTYCGFDPVVYVKDPTLAADKIREFLKERSEKPENLLRPILNIPRATTGQTLNSTKNSQVGVSERKGQTLSLQG